MPYTHVDCFSGPVAFALVCMQQDLKQKLRLNI